MARCNQITLTVALGRYRQIIDMQDPTQEVSELLRETEDAEHEFWNKRNKLLFRVGQLVTSKKL